MQKEQVVQVVQEALRGLRVITIGFKPEAMRLTGAFPSIHLLLEPLKDKVHVWDIYLHEMKRWDDDIYTFASRQRKIFLAPTPVTLTDKFDYKSDVDLFLSCTLPNIEQIEVFKLK